MDGPNPATPAQVKLLRVLIRKVEACGRTVHEDPDRLTKSEASELIDHLQELLEIEARNA